MQYCIIWADTRPLVQLDLAQKIKEGCSQEGLVGFIFSTIGVRSDSAKCYLVATQFLTLKSSAMRSRWAQMVRLTVFSFRVHEVMARQECATRKNQLSRL